MKANLLPTLQVGRFLDPKAKSRFKVEKLFSTSLATNKRFLTRNSLFFNYLICIEINIDFVRVIIFARQTFLF